MIRVIKIEKIIRSTALGATFVEMSNVRIDQAFRLQKSIIQPGVYYTGPLPASFGVFPGLVITTVHT